MKSISRWLCSNGSKNLFVKIVHPGGHVELHDRPILASELLNRNPKCCVAHPTVFQQPYAIVSPETTLVLGHKYYVVPLGTIRKLQLKYPRADDSKNVDDLDSSSACWLFRNSNNNEKEKNGRSTKIRASSTESLSEYANTRSNMKKRGSPSSSSSSSSPPGRLSLVSEV
ncbi:hypothetical protein ACS0TY_020771 [Phlomoides rotata]